MIKNGELTNEQAELIYLGVWSSSPTQSKSTTRPPLHTKPPPPRRPSIGATLPTPQSKPQAQSPPATDNAIATDIDYDPSVVVEMLSEEQLSSHLRTICNVIGNENATTTDVDVAIRRASVQCFAAINEHARVTDSNKDKQQNDNSAGQQESVDALTDFGVALSQMNAPVPLPPPENKAHDTLEAHHLVDSWQRCRFIDDFQNFLWISLCKK